MEDQNELLWNQYTKLIDIYKFYLDIVLKANLFYYAITGGILTFIFSAKGQNKFVILSLLLPIGMGILLSYIFWRGKKLYEKIEEAIKKLKDQLNLIEVPNTVILIDALHYSVILFLMTAIGMVILIGLVSFGLLDIGYVSEK